jgi:hypothetical protein
MKYLCHFDVIYFAGLFVERLTDDQKLIEACLAN